MSRPEFMKAISLGSSVHEEKFPNRIVLIRAIRAAVVFASHLRSSVKIRGCLCLFYPLTTNHYPLFPHHTRP